MFDVRAVTTLNLDHHHGAAMYALSVQRYILSAATRGATSDLNPLTSFHCVEHHHYAFRNTWYVPSLTSPLVNANVTISL